MMRRRVFLTAFLCLLTMVAAHAQKGLQIDSLFSGSIKAGSQAIDRVASLVEADSRKALDRKIDYVGGQMYYALLRLRADGSGENEYIGFQIKGIGKEKVTQDSAGNTVVGYELDENARGPFKQAYVTVVYLRGKATMNDLKKMFKQR